MIPRNIRGGLIILCIDVRGQGDRGALLPITLRAGRAGVQATPVDRVVQGRRREANQARVPCTATPMQTLESSKIPNYNHVAHSGEKHKDRYSNIHACTPRPTQTNTTASSSTPSETSTSTPATCTQSSMATSTPSSHRHPSKMWSNTSGPPATTIRSAGSSCSAPSKTPIAAYLPPHAATGREVLARTREKL